MNRLRLISIIQILIGILSVKYLGYFAAVAYTFVGISTLILSYKESRFEKLGNAMSYVGTALLILNVVFILKGASN